jgi:hypothetical protein
MDHLLDILNLQFPAALDGWGLWAALAGLGLIVGVSTGLFGVGGGFMVTPLLNVLIGVPYELAVGSSLCFIVGTSSSGLAGHWRLGNVEPRTIATLASGSVIGAILGDEIQKLLIRYVADGDERVFTEIMHVFFILLLLVTAWLIWRGPKAHHTGKTPVQRLKLPPYVQLRRAGLESVSLPAMIGIGLGVGVLTGLLGVGGGVLMMPILILAIGLKPHQAVGTSLGVVLLAAVIATIWKGYQDKVSLAIAMALLVTSTIGVQVGMVLCMKLHAEKLRRYFAIVVLLAAALVGADLLGTLLGKG